MKLFSNENVKICYICKEKFKDKYAQDKKYCKITDHCHYVGECRGAEHSICNLRYTILEEITLVFHNGANHDYHFIKKELAEEFEEQYTCLGENTEKDNFFSSHRKRSCNNC